MRDILYKTLDGLFAVFSVNKGYVVMGRIERETWRWVAGPFKDIQEAIAWTSKAPRPSSTVVKGRRSHLRLVK